MIKAKGTIGGRETVFLGLSFANLDKLRSAPLDDHIRIKAEDLNLPFDIIITSGETEAAITELLMSAIGPSTKVHIDRKQKS